MSPLQEFKIALARLSGLPNFVTRKARRTSAYKIYPPINFTYIDEMMTFMCKSKFPMIKIATIITITNQNCFLLWSDVFIFGTIHCLGQGISVLINCSIPSLVYDNLISYSPNAHVWLRFLVGQKRNPSCLGILKSRPMSPAYFYHMSFMKMSISCLLVSTTNIYRIH
jgi:hypothetical protein